MATNINKNAINQSFLEFYVLHKELTGLVKKYKAGVNAISKMTDLQEMQAKMAQIMNLRVKIEQGVPVIVQSLHQCICLLMPMAHKEKIRKRIDELTVCKGEYINLLKYISETMPLFQSILTSEQIWSNSDYQR